MPSPTETPNPRLRGLELAVRFVLVGVLNTGFSYGVYAALVWFGLPYSLASLLSLLLGIVFSFRTQGRLVWGHSAWDRAGRFVLVWALIYAFNVGFIGLLVRWGLDAYSAGALALVPVAALSFVLQRYIVFAPTRAAGKLPLSGADPP